MAMENRLELKLLQKLILTPQLQQAIKLLQMPQLELSQTLSNELIENPLLEEASEEPAEVDTPEGESEEPQDFELKEEAEVDFERTMPSSVEDYFEERGLDGRDLGYFTPGYVLTTTPEQYMASSSDLKEHLLWQLRFADASEGIKTVGECVIGNLDDNGYLQATDEEIAESAACCLEDARLAVRLVQTFDPGGVGARDLRECLTLQLKELELLGSVVELIIANNLDDIVKRKYKEIAKQHACKVDEVMHAIKVIESLEPKPGRNFSSSTPVYIAPDVYITKAGGEYQIVLNEDNLPSLKINSYYRKLLATKHTLPKEERQYLEDKLRSATWLLKSLDHRHKTIYRVSESILNFQRGFFEQGVGSLKPLNLKDVAMDLQMHESTISRATANKYLSCGHGLFPFRYFFSSGISSDSGRVSSTSVKETIRKIISEESPKKPLSDQKLAEILKGQNVVLARRTIAKYREELNIPSHAHRKRLP